MDTITINRQERDRVLDWLTGTFVGVADEVEFLKANGHIDEAEAMYGRAIWGLDLFFDLDSRSPDGCEVAATDQLKELIETERQNAEERTTWGMGERLDRPHRFAGRCMRTIAAEERELGHADLAVAAALLEKLEAVPA